MPRSWWKGVCGFWKNVLQIAKYNIQIKQPSECMPYAALVLTGDVNHIYFMS
jgi:hypothetical protein